MFDAKAGPIFAKWSFFNLVIVEKKRRNIIFHDSDFSDILFNGIGTQETSAYKSWRKLKLVYAKIFIFSNIVIN